MSAKVIPTFLLKGIDINKINEDYKNGFFNKPVKKTGKINISTNSNLLNPNYGDSNQSAIYTVKDRNNSSVVIATSNHKNFEVIKSGAEFVHPGICEICLKNFKHKPLGYPVEYKELSLFVENEETNRIFYVFWTEYEVFCSFQCTLAYIRRVGFKDITMMESESMLKLLYRLTYPGQGIIRPTQDSRLLYSRGGSLSEKDHENIKHIYQRTDRIVILPAKVEYIMNNYMKPNLTPINLMEKSK